MLMLLSTLDDEEQKDKFLLLYEVYKTKVFNMANRILKDPYLAEDVSQEVFTILARDDILSKIGQVDHPETKAYIAIMTQNTSINVFNKRKREQGISITEKNVRYIEEMDSWDNTQEVISKMDLEDLVVNIKKLPKKYYLPMILKYLHEFSDKETARMLNIQETTVRKRLERARKQLRVQYERETENIKKKKK